MNLNYLAIILLLGCSSLEETNVPNSESERSDSDYDDSYHDNTLVPYESNPCAPIVLKRTFQGEDYFLLIPVECQMELIDKGRPEQDNLLPEMEEMFFEETPV